MNELALFAGAGGGILGGKLLGWRTICAVEWEPYAACVLAARQNDKVLPPFPIWDDVQTFDGKPWRGIVDVVSGGFPCQDISAAGKGAGIEGERSGMWREMVRVVCEIRPRYVFVENSPMLTSRGLGVVFGDLAKMGFNAKWGVLGAADVGANHQRDRIWIVGKMADSNLSHGKGNKCTERTQSKYTNFDCSSQLAYTSDERNAWRQWVMGFAEQEHNSGGSQANGSREWWKTEPNVGRVANGVAARVDRLKAIGNGQVPFCAATAWKILNELAAS
jgi:DNA (cytosine-5)-methyltransferase 1